MGQCGAKRNQNYKKLFIEDLNIDSILSEDVSEEKFWYILHRNGRLVGCIGSREYDQICKTKQIVIKTDCMYIHTGEKEKQAAAELFTVNDRLRKLPVVDEDGRLMYEYVRSIETYYDELDISCGVNRGKKYEEEIVVSLTSFGNRLDTVHIAVKSIMTQTLKPDVIVLYIAKEDSQKKIHQEEKLVQAGLKIVRNAEDLKPHKKYFYAMQEYPKSLIITVDDDAIYDEDLLEDLYEKHLKYPKAVICGRGHRMTKKDGRVNPYDMWEGCVQSISPERGICPTGIGGILYPCGSYRKAFLDKKGILETSICGDDLWLKTVELMEDVKVYAIGKLPARIIEGSQEEALYIENANNKRNDEYLYRIQAYFDINIADLF